MMKKSLRTFALAAAAALTLSVGGGGAFAQTGTTPPPAPPVAATPKGAGNIDVNKEDASLEIHKRLNPESLGEPTGGADENVSGKKLEGIRFKATKLNLKLDNNADLAKAANLKPSEVTEAMKTGPVFNGKTDKKGHIKWDKIPVGVYLVEELPAEEGDEIKAEGEKVDASTIKRAEPFIVRVPMSNAKGDAWNYNVHVYPKNTSTKVEKTVDDADQNVGDFITYTVKATVPTPAEGYKRTKFRIVDDYDETKLEAGSIKEVTVSVNGTALESGDFTSNNENGKLTVEVTNLEKLPNNAEVTLSFKIMVKDVGKIVNKAESIVNEYNSETDDEKETDTPSNEVVTYEGKVKVVKEDNGEGDAAKRLSGAKFDLYRCDAATQDGLTEKINKDDKPYVTGDDGTFVTKGLHVTDLENSTDTIDKQYCLVETQAPAGYITPTGDDAVTAFKLTIEDLGSDYLQVKQLSAIKNKPSDVPDLPLTGGQGILLLVLGGAAVAGLAVYSARRNSVKE